MGIAYPYPIIVKRAVRRAKTRLTRKTYSLLYVGYSFSYIICAPSQTNRISINKHRLLNLIKMQQAHLHDIGHLIHPSKALIDRRLYPPKLP